MAEWGFWDWIGYGALFITVAMSALDQSVKGTTYLKAALAPILQSAPWNYLPMTFLMIATVVLAGRAIFGGSSLPPPVADLEAPASKSASSAIAFFEPAYLLDLVMGRTMAEREVLLDLYRGQQLRGTGSFRNAVPLLAGDRATLFLAISPEGQIGCIVAGDAAKTAMTIEVGRSVTVVGQIGGDLSFDTVSLEPCGIVSLN